MTQFNPEGDLQFQLDIILNGGIEFGDNIRGGFIEFETKGTVEEIQHNLGYTPSGFLVILKTGDVSIWARKLKEWNSQSLFLESSVKNLTVRLFVL